MKNFSGCQLIGSLGSCKTYAEEQLPTIPNSACEPIVSNKAAKQSRNNSMTKFRKSSGNLSQGKVKWNMTLRKRISQAGRTERFFRKSFNSVNKEERLLQTYKCSLFTTAGPIKGRMFITSERITFHSRNDLKLKTLKGEVAKHPYKVSVPVSKINKTALSVNPNSPEEKYVQLVTVDEFEFWFMGFINYQRFFESLCLAISGEQ